MVLYSYHGRCWKVGVTSPAPRPILLPCHPLSSALEVGLLNPARASGECCKLPIGVWGGASSEIELGAFSP